MPTCVRQRPPLELLSRARLADTNGPTGHADETATLFSRCEVHRINSAGHWPFVDAPDAVVGIVRRFLDGLG